MPTNYITLSFDMETDIGSWTLGDRGMREGTPEILRVLECHGCKATFFFTGREAQNHPEMVNRVAADGHEIGCHTMFHETIGEAVFDMPGANFVLPSEVEGRLEIATDVVESSAGMRPVSFRSPRLFGSTTMLNVLEDLGYLVDSSFPSYFYGRDFLPYHPSREDWSKDGDMRILEIPPFFDTEASEDDEKHRIRDQWPMMRLRGADWFVDLSKRMQEKVKDDNGNSMLTIYLHPWEFAEMPKTIVTDEATITFKPFLHDNCGDFSVRALDEYIGRMMSTNTRFITMKDFAALYCRTVPEKA